MARRLTTRTRKPTRRLPTAEDYAFLMVAAMYDEGFTTTAIKETARLAVENNAPDADHQFERHQIREFGKVIAPARAVAETLHRLALAL
jgi:hypothetical protein